MTEALNPQDGAARPGPRAPNRRILVVDDEPLIRGMNTDALAREGYHVDAASNGEEAWAVLGADSYDLLVTDNRMPRLSGMGLIRKMRDADMGLPVILATGIAPFEAVERDPGLRIAAVLMKPYSMGQLVSTAASVFNGGCCEPSRVWGRGTDPQYGGGACRFDGGCSW